MLSFVAGSFVAGSSVAGSFVVRTLVVAVTAASCWLVPAASSAAEGQELQARTARMIADLGLLEAPRPVRESPGWTKPRRIVVRDATPERLQWLQGAAPGVELVPAATAADVPRVVGDADAVLGSCSAPIFEAGKSVRWIQVYNAGVEACVAALGLRERGILLTNMQKIAGPVMAEHVMAMVLSFARRMPQFAEAQRAGVWRADAEGGPGAFELSGKTVLVAGLGGIGTEVARLSHAFGMRVIATRASQRAAPPFVSHVGTPDQLLTLLREADIVVNTLPLTPETRGLFDAKAFAAMKPGAYFINVGRGSTVVTADMVQALQKKTLAGAGLDVTDPEPLPAGHALWSLPNVIVTPHVSADSDDREDRWLLVRENLRRYVAGEKMLSVVDTARGY